MTNYMVELTRDLLRQYGEMSEPITDAKNDAN